MIKLIHNNVVEQMILLIQSLTNYPTKVSIYLINHKDNFFNSLFFFFAI